MRLLTSANFYNTEMTDGEIIACYHDLWQIEQAFRMSKTDLQARPIFHQRQEAIRAHLLICFMALMMEKFMEIKTSKSLRTIRDELWQIQEAHVKNEETGETHVLSMALSTEMRTALAEILDFTH